MLTNYGDSNFLGLSSMPSPGLPKEREENGLTHGSADIRGIMLLWCVWKNGGYGSSVAGPIANTVLQAIVAQ